MKDMFGIDTTLTELGVAATTTRRSRWRVNAGLDDFHPVGMNTATEPGTRSVAFRRLGAGKSEKPA